MSLLVVEKLSRPPMLDAVSFSLDAGQCVGVEGPSGSGKSVLLRAIADLDPAQGTVSLDGQPRTAMPASEWRARVCYVAAEPAWWMDRVGDHFKDIDRGRKFAAEMGLEGAMDWRVERLSTGEGQRLSLARALAGRSRLLLLDEPTSGLDPDATERVVACLRRFMDDGGAVVLVAHDPDLLHDMTTRRYRMADGVFGANDEAISDEAISDEAISDEAMVPSGGEQD